MRAGESLGLIAQRNGVTVSQLKHWNGLRVTASNPGSACGSEKEAPVRAAAKPVQQKAPEPVAEKESAKDTGVHPPHHPERRHAVGHRQQVPGRVRGGPSKRLNSDLNFRRLSPGKAIAWGSSGMKSPSSSSLPCAALLAARRGVTVKPRAAGAQGEVPVVMDTRAGTGMPVLAPAACVGVFPAAAAAQQATSRGNALAVRRGFAEPPRRAAGRIWVQAGPAWWWRQPGRFARGQVVLRGGAELTGLTGACSSGRRVLTFDVPGRIGRLAGEIR